MKSALNTALSRRLPFAVAVIWAFIMMAMPLSAQYRGVLQGTITDPSGGLVPNATVTLTSTETNTSKTATTGPSGVYSISGLAPGTYSLTVDKPGFAKKAVLVSLTSEQTQSQNVQLELAQTAATTVTVTAAAAPVLDTATATISGTLSSREIQALPTFGRDTFQVAQLAPGTFGDNARS